MSEENVEVVRRLFEVYERNSLDLDAAAEFWHPDIDWRAIEGAPDDIGVFSGHEAMRHYYSQWGETFDGIRARAVELIDAGDQVVAVVEVTGCMKDSEARVEMRLAIVQTVREGKIIRGREYATREEAIAAAGLQE